MSSLQGLGRQFRDPLRLSGLQRVALQPSWVPYGALEFISPKTGRYYAGKARRDTLAAGLASAGLAFTRGSAAFQCNGVATLESVAVDVPRLEYNPVTQARRGLFMEGPMTPLLSNTEAFENPYWTKTTVPFAAGDVNQDVAPDGTTTADRYRPTNSAGNQIARTTGITVVNGSRYTLSTYAKAAALTWFKTGFFYSALRLGWFDLANFVVGNVSGGGAIALRIDRAPNGYGRCQMAHTMSTTSPQALFQSATGDNASASGGDNVKYLSMWGAQLELGNFASSYNAGVARAADSLKRTITTPSRFARVIAFEAAPGLPLTRQVIWQMDNETEGSRACAYRDTSGNIRAVVTNASSETVNFDLGNVDNDSFNRIAIAYTGTSFRAVLNGGTVQAATAAMPTVTTERFGCGATAGDEIYGIVAEIESYDMLGNSSLIEKSRVFPYWVATDSANRPAFIYAKPILGRFYYNNTVYPTLAEFQAALGATLGAGSDWNFPFSDGTITLMYGGRAVTGAGTNKTQLQIDSGSVNNRMGFHRGTATNVGVDSIVSNGTVWWGQDTQNVQNGQPYKLAASFAATANSEWVSQDGQSYTANTTPNVPAGLTTFRVGNNIDGSRIDTDELWEFAVWKNPLGQSDVNYIAKPAWAAWGEGDSYMGGANGVSVMWAIARLFKRYVANLGVGGSTLAEQDTRVASEAASYVGVPFVHWDGDPNGADVDISVDLAHYASIIAALGHQKFVIVAPLTRTGQTTQQRQRCRDLSAALSAAYPGHVVDARAILYARSDGSDNDKADIALDCCPRSQLQDGVHLISAAMDAVVTLGIMPILSGYMDPE